MKRLATCNPKTASSARRTPPGSGLASAAPEPHSRAGEPALCPQIAGSRSANSGGLFHVEQKRRVGLRISIGLGLRPECRWSTVPAGHKSAAYI